MNDPQSQQDLYSLKDIQGEAIRYDKLRDKIECTKYLEWILMVFECIPSNEENDQLEREIKYIRLDSHRFLFTGLENAEYGFLVNTFG